MKTLNIVIPYERIYAFHMILTISSDYLRTENEFVVFVTRQLVDIFVYYIVMHNTVNSLLVYIQDIIRPRHSLTLTKNHAKVNIFFWGKGAPSLFTKTIMRLKNGVH